MPLLNGQADIKSRVQPSTVLVLGALVYAAAVVWPPLILLLAAILAKLLPFCYRVNDDAVSRRKLWRLFEEYGNDEWNELLKPNAKEVQLEESYWINRRYVNYKVTINVIF
jgi:hypothetical protein